jgi:2-(1,2-epoxy-1,2-dihydrophenyl)acetyl-CoA isomerase
MTNDTDNPTSPTLLIRNEGRLRILILNRPDRLNALNPDLHHCLRAAVAEAAADPQVGAVLLTGAGRGFCSGGDVRRDNAKHSAPESVEARADSIKVHGGTVKLLSEMPKPSIALINGAAAGSGLAIALACDIRIATRSAVLRSAYARVGLSGDLGITYFLTRIVGAARARELMLLNEKIDAERALQLGLVTQIVEDAERETTGMNIARMLAGGPTVAYRYMKQNLLLAETASLDHVIEREAYNTARVVRTHDAAEASAAFREKREPDFTGR